MYVIDYFKKLARKSNVPMIIYMCLNVAIISFVMLVVISEYEYVSTSVVISTVFWSIILYVVSIAIALSPVGEKMLRRKSRAFNIANKQQAEYLNGIFQEVYASAKEVDPAIPDGIKLYISEDQFLNAFALGRRTICITRGLAECDPETIKGVLAHEFGHIAHHDTDNILIVTVGNFLITTIVTVIQVAADIFGFFIKVVDFGDAEGFLVKVIGFLEYLALKIALWIFMFLWTKIGVLLVMKTSRECEYEADAFAARIGYGENLLGFFKTEFPVTTAKQKGVFAALSDSHPRTELRIERLESLL